MTKYYKFEYKYIGEKPVFRGRCAVTECVDFLKSGELLDVLEEKVKSEAIITGLMEIDEQEYRNSKPQRCTSTRGTPAMVF